MSTLRSGGAGQAHRSRRQDEVEDIENEQNTELGIRDVSDSAYIVLRDIHEIYGSCAGSRIINESHFNNGALTRKDIPPRKRISDSEGLLAFVISFRPPQLFNFVQVM